MWPSSHASLQDPLLAGKKGVALRLSKAWRGACLVLFTSLGGCATAVFDEARSQYYAGDPVAGVAVLDQANQANKIPDRNELLLHVERGLMLHRAGLYKESAEALIQASRVIEDDDRISVSEQATSLLSNDWSKRYFGEYSERLWVHTYAMMSFILADQPESAAVEARQALEVLQSHPEALEDAAYSRALIALSFELAGQSNDAYVAYRALHEQFPESSLAMATYQLARLVGSDDANTWRSRVDERLLEDYASGGPEAVLLVSTGRGPIKKSASLYYFYERIAFPTYVQVPQVYGEISVNDDSGKELLREQISTDIYRVSQDALSARGKRLLAKAAVRVKVKHEIVQELRSSDQAVAGLLGIAFFLLEEADTRSWQSLPADLTLLRVPLASGQDSLTVRYGGSEVRLQLDPHQNKKPQVFSLHF